MSASLFPGIELPRSSKEQYRRDAQVVILRQTLRGLEVTADDVQAVLPCPSTVDVNNLGLAFGTLSHEGIIAPVRFTTSSRPARHSGVHRAWRIADAKYGRKYLAALESSRSNQ